MSTIEDYRKTSAYLTVSEKADEAEKLCNHAELLERQLVLTHKLLRDRYSFYYLSTDIYAATKELLGDKV